MQTTVLPVGSLVNAIADEAEELFCFYLVDLEGTHIQESIWFEHDEVEAAEVIASPLVDFEVNV